MESAKCAQTECHIAKEFDWLWDNTYTLARAKG